jgi:predicted N-acetyltransferase YhbS
MTYAIRPARAKEFSLLPEIERKASRRFAASRFSQVADEEPSSVEFIEAVARAGLVVVAADATAPVGFALAGFLDRAVHLYELSVLEDHGRRGLGRNLIDEVCRFAAGAGLSAATLVTFRDIPWNGPFYQRTGFRFLAREEWTPALHLLHLREIDSALPVAERGFMRKELE